MRILYVIPFFQHPSIGGPTRCYYFLRELSKRHAITLLSPIKSKVPDTALAEMTSYAEKVLTFGPIRKLSGSAAENTSRRINIIKKVQRELRFKETLKEMRKAFLNLVENESFDVILFHGKAVFDILDNWNKLPIVFDFCDATTMRIRQHMRFAKGIKWLTLLTQYAKMKRTEKKIIEKTPHLAFVSCRDRNGVLDHPGNGVRVVPIGVDLEFWTRRSSSLVDNCIVFTGVMSYGPNADAGLYLIEKILPLVRVLQPRLEVYIVGKNPSSELIEKASQYEDITVTGFVPDVRNYLERATVFVAPIRYGSGVQNKVLEALAMEVPVVCTSLVAEGLYFDGHKEPPVGIAHNPEEFAKAIVKAFEGRKERDRLAAEGRRYVEKHFSWERNAEALEHMCFKAANYAAKYSG